ncbi:hypothetical protein A6A06_01730 [Streptomyces sp. CB02923]|uniref:ABC transporter ATP-binding protein n=1 Tax=Streptomyces sp. CB02923 TaxID=1718985 RepID=UPI00093EAC28|nr:ABC transporter ATP-binding protein [Streptomyces sp. CB02923]OKI09449.1 hypothetical protein A6A06_01730 [Streptomyces sp. CB02923]
MQTDLEVRGLVKAFGPRKVLDGVDLTAHRGEILAVLGPNGAGKTTLMSIVAGLLRPDAGSVRALGADALASPRALRGRLGLAGQNIAFYPAHTALENLRFFGAVGGLRGRALTASVDEVLSMLELTGQRDQMAGELSGGQQRRLHAGCALVHRPDLILLDEPTAGADPQTRSRLLETVRELATRGATVLYTTHYLPEVEELKATVAVLGAGRILARGSVDDLITRHARSEVALRFEGGVPEVDWQEARTSDDALYLPTSRPAVDIIEALRSLGDHQDRLRAVEVNQADLERAYVNILASEGVS